MDTRDNETKCFALFAQPDRHHARLLRTIRPIGHRQTRCTIPEFDDKPIAEAAAGGPRIRLEPRGYVLGQLTRKRDGQTLILHLRTFPERAHKLRVAGRTLFTHEYMD